MTRVSRFSQVSNDVVTMPIDDDSCYEEQYAGNSIPSNKIRSPFGKIRIGKPIKASALQAP